MYHNGTTPEVLVQEARVGESVGLDKFRDFLALVEEQVQEFVNRLVVRCFEVDNQRLVVLLLGPFELRLRGVDLPGRPPGTSLIEQAGTLLHQGRQLVVGVSRVQGQAAAGVGGAGGLFREQILH